MDKCYGLAPTKFSGVRNVEVTPAEVAHFSVVFDDLTAARKAAAFATEYGDYIEGNLRGVFRLSVADLPRYCACRKKLQGDVQMIQINVYDALAMIYDANANRLARLAMTNDNADADKLQHEIAEFSTLADACRLKARSVKPIANTNDNPTKDYVELRAATVGLILREYEGGFALLDVATQLFLPPSMPICPMTLAEISRWLDLSGVATD